MNIKSINRKHFVIESVLTKPVIAPNELRQLSQRDKNNVGAINKSGKRVDIVQKASLNPKMGTQFPIETETKR